MMSSDQINNYSAKILDKLYPKLIRELELIKLAQEVGIYIDGEYKNMLGKTIKLYLSKNASHLRNEVSGASEYEYSPIEKSLLESEEEKFLFDLLEGK